MPRSPRLPLLGALAGLVGLVVTGLLAYLVPLARSRDSATLQAFTELNRPRVTEAISHVAHLADPVPYGFFGLILILVALLRGRPRTAGLIVVLLLATGYTTHTLKPLLASPRYDEWLGTGQIAAASWPSGHATASMTLALCAVLAAPARLRPTVAAAGVCFALGVSFSILALGWHFPSDVLGGYLVAGTWTCLGVAALIALERRWPQRERGPADLRPVDAVGPVVIAASALLAGVAIAMARPEEATQFLSDHRPFVVGATLIALLATTVVAALARGLRGLVQA